MTAPLDGVKVLELGTLIAGPFAARMMAEFGAEVIKVEDPDGGDPLRRWRHLHDGTSLWWAVQARNKKSVALNLKDPRACELARRLAGRADIVIENFRPGVLERLGLGYPQLAELNAATIMVRLSGYGQTGPMRDRPRPARPGPARSPAAGRTEAGEMQCAEPIWARCRATVSERPLHHLAQGRVSY